MGLYGQPIGLYGQPKGVREDGGLMAPDHQEHVLYGVRWGRMGSYGVIRGHMGLYGQPIGLYGQPIGLYGGIWGHMDSP